MSRNIEGRFQKDVIDEIEERIPGALVTKVEPYIQGWPDLLILYKNRWATLETKRSKNANKQPNQDYYVDLMDNWSFSRFICPENKEEVLNDLQHALRS